MPGTSAAYAASAAEVSPVDAQADERETRRPSPR